MKRSTRLLSAVVAFTLLFAGCSGGDDEDGGDATPGASGPTAAADQGSGDPAPATIAAGGDEEAQRPPDACELLTPAEIEAATGTAPIEPPSASTELQCAYASASAPDFFTIRVSKEASQEQFETRAAGLGGTTVEGMGDAAYQNATGTAILVLAGVWSLRLDYPSTGDVDPLILQDLAAQALARFE